MRLLNEHFLAVHNVEALGELRVGAQGVRYSASGEVVDGSGGAALLDVGDGCLCFHASQFLCEDACECYVPVAQFGNVYDAFLAVFVGKEVSYVAEYPLVGVGRCGAANLLSVDVGGDDAIIYCEDDAVPLAFLDDAAVAQAARESGVARL